MNDASSPLVDSGIAETDAMLPIAVGPIDCRMDSDCLGPTSCRITDPGGSCSGCQNQSQCGPSYSCSTQGNCERSCAQQSDCNLGKSCTSQGHCTPRICTDTQPCPSPYDCNLASNRCERPQCDSTSPPLCPPGFSCGSSSVCIENEL